MGLRHHLKVQKARKFNLPAIQETWVPFLGWEDPLEKGMATPVILTGEFQGWRSLAGYSPEGCKESDMIEKLMLSFSLTSRVHRH